MSRAFQATAVRSLSLLSGLFGASKMESAPLSIRQYQPAKPEGPFPYTARDMTPMEAGNDTSFYSAPRFVTHIDDNAINNLQVYYEGNLPKKGRILDFCSSWISHYPASIKRAGQDGELEILGTGMNEAELSKNAVLSAYSVQDLNHDPEVRLPGDAPGKLDASTCVVSIDYLTKPVEVLASIRRQTNQGGKVHLAMSNRCFPTKVVGRWLKVDEEQRLDMVGDYLWWSGWRDIEIVTVVQASFLHDPLWVIRATNSAELSE